METNNPQNTNLSKILAIVMIIAVTALLVIGIHRLTRANLLGYDFYYYWNSARSFTLEGLYPYSDEVAVQNQIGLYGRPAEGAEDPSFFKNPIYSIFFLVPFSLLPYDWAVAVWIVFNILAVIWGIKYSLPTLSPFYVIGFLFFYPVGFCLIEGNFSLLVGLSLIYVIEKIIRSSDRPTVTVQIVSGLLLVVSTFKPQFSWIFVICVMLYCLKNKFYTILATFFGALMIMGGYMLWKFPSWPIDFIGLVLTYGQATQYIPVRYQILPHILSATLNTALGDSILLMLLGMTVVVLWRFVITKQSSNYLSVVNMCAVTTYFAHPSGLSYEQIVLLLPILIWIGSEDQMGKKLKWFWLFAMVFSYLPLYFEKVYSGYGLVTLLPFCLFLIWLLYDNYRRLFNLPLDKSMNR